MPSRFDSDAVFAALLGEQEHGCWTLAPTAEYRSRRRYRGDSLVLESHFETADGEVELIDFMATSLDEEVHSHVLRIVRCTRGFVLGHGLSHQAMPPPLDPWQVLAQTEAFWSDWTSRCTHEGRWGHQVMRSLVVLKGLSYLPTGAIVAAPTTSLPELMGEGMPKPEPYSSGCWGYATMWACWPKNTIHAAGRCLVTSRRATPSWRWLTAQCGCMGLLRQGGSFTGIMIGWAAYLRPASLFPG